MFREGRPTTILDDHCRSLANYAGLLASVMQGENNYAGAEIESQEVRIIQGQVSTSPASTFYI